MLSKSDRVALDVPIQPALIDLSEDAQVAHDVKLHDTSSQSNQLGDVEQVLSIVVKSHQLKWDQSNEVVNEFPSEVVARNYRETFLLLFNPSLPWFTNCGHEGQHHVIEENQFYHNHCWIKGLITMPKSTIMSVYEATYQAQDIHNLLPYLVAN